MPASRGCKALFVLSLLLTSTNSIAAPTPPANNDQTASVTPPKLTHEIKAPYPEQAKKEKREGTVTLAIDIDATGHVTQVTVLQSVSTDLDEAASSAAKEFVFEPAKKNGAPIASRIRYQYTFKLEPESSKPADPSPPVETKPITTTGSLGGQVLIRDALLFLPGAKVRIFQEKKLIAETTTDNQGKWTYSDLQPGKYQIEVVSEGYKKAKFEESVLLSQRTEVVYRLDTDSDLDTIDVKTPPPARQVTYHSLSRDEIQKSPGTQGDVLKAVQNLPGVARSPAPPAGALIVRGSYPQSTQVFIDGAWLPRMFHFGGLTSIIPSEFIETLDYYPGDFGAKFGRGTGGIIDVKTKAIATDGKYHGVAQVDLMDARIMAEGPVPFLKGWTFMVGARRSWLDSWLGPVMRDAGTNVSTAPYYYDYQAFVETKPSSKSRFRIGVYGGADAMSTIQTKIVETDPAVAGKNGISSGYHRISTTFDTELATGSTLQSMAYIGKELEGITFGRIRADNNITIYGMRTDLALKLSNQFTLRTGIDILGAWADVDLQIPFLPNPSDNATSTFSSSRWTSVHKTASWQRPGAYVELEAKPARWLKATTGLRADYTHENTELKASPRASVAFLVRDTYPKTTIRTSAGFYFQPPEPIDLILKGGDKLSSESGKQVSVGFEQDLSKHLELSVETYTKMLDSLVSREQGPSGNLVYANRGQGNVIGAEFLLKLNHSRLYGSIAYSISRSTRQNTPEAPVLPFEYDQTHVLTAISSYKLGRGWQVGARFRYATNIPFTPCRSGLLDISSGAYACVPGAQMSERLPAFHQLDVRVDKTWTFSSWRLSAYLDVQNVYNHQNAEGIIYSYDRSSRTYQAGLPLLPILGLRGEL